MILNTQALRAITSLAIAVTIGLAPRRAEALRYYDGEVTPAVIISGTDLDGEPFGILENTSWVVMRKYGIELGIRGRKCYEAQEDDDTTSTCPMNEYESNKDGTFNFEAGSIPQGASLCPINYGALEDVEGGPTWCIDYSINVNYEEDDDDGEEAAQYRQRGRKLWWMEEEVEPKVLTDFEYQLSLDADPSCTTNSTTWDPINDSLDGLSCLDAFYMGDNDTPSGNGTEALCGDDSYNGTVSDSSIAQQTINYVLLTDPPQGGYPRIDPDPVRDTFNPDTTPATYSITLKAYCRDDDYDCKRKNSSGGGKSEGTGTTARSGSTKNSKGGNTGDDDEGKNSKSGKNDDDKASSGKKKYDNRYGHDRKLYAQDDYHFKDYDVEEGPVEIASVTVHFLIGGGDGTDTDGDGICDSQDIWGNCPDPEEECKYGYLEIDGCETMACKDACLIPDWVYNCEKYEHDCDDYLTCVETGANAAAANGFITREQSGSVKECACHADVCKESEKSKSKTSKGGKYDGYKKDYDEDKGGDRRRRRKSNKARRLNEPAGFEFDSPAGKPTSSLVKIEDGGRRVTTRRRSLNRYPTKTIGLRT